MPSANFPPNTVFDSLFSYEGGMNSGVNPLLLRKNEMSYASGLTVRGTFPNPRPPRMRYQLQFASQQIATAFTTGLFQGYCYYKPDVGTETLLVSISGRLYQIVPNPATLIATVADVTGANPQSATVTQAWLWQAENFVFWNDGVNLPVFFNGTTTKRSNGQVPPPAPIFTTNADFTIPAGYSYLSVPPPAPIAVVLTGNFTGANGDTIGINLGSTLPLTGTVVAGAGTPNITINLNIVNVTPPIALVVAKGSSLQDTQGLTFVPQFPVGRMGVYGRGRVWMALANGKDFIAGDIVKGPSGTKALNYRDSVLNVTENNYLVGGGTFTVPGAIGDIRAMLFVAQPDTSLGQGPLLIFTPTHVFSCNAPVDRLTWQSLTNPILTETYIANGALGTNSTFNINSDTWFRSADGIRSLQQSRRDFQEWINTPISREVTRVLSQDDQNLLAFGTGVFFDNRALMTAIPVSTPNGVYNRTLIVVNTDLITKIGEKGQPCYDGVWPGMNILGMVVGDFSLVQRCFQFVFNTVLNVFELWEQLPSFSADVINNPKTAIVGDNNTDAIEWWFETGAITFKEDLEHRTFKRLYNGEIYVDNLVGKVRFQVFYQPDQYPCWIPWLAWEECATQNKGDGSNIKPQFRPRMGLGAPPNMGCDPSTSRPFTDGYTYQMKIVINGQCEFIGARIAAVIIPEPTFAPPACKPIC